jgi:preprotein translocase subunit SecG
VLTFPLIAALGQTIFQLLLSATAIFLILLVLVQRGRGGGLAGALGGMGGSSAFGAKAGDVFTRVTIVAAAIWIILCIVAANVGPSTGSRVDTGAAPPSRGLGGVPAMSGLVTGDENEADKAAGGETDGEPAPSGDAAEPSDESGHEPLE